jgi:hypothetical protein
MKDFNPINRHGRKAKASRKPHDPLYGVMVEEVQTGQVRRVGPAMAQLVAERFIVAINTQIALGKERNWSNPHLVRV